MATIAMRNWFVKNLGDALFAQEELDRIGVLYRSICGREDGPRGAGVFYRHDSEGRLHCQVLAYFSPAAAALAEVVQAEPCEPPSPEGLSLLEGSPDVHKALSTKDRNEATDQGGALQRNR